MPVVWKWFMPLPPFARCRWVASVSSRALQCGFPVPHGPRDQHFAAHDEPRGAQKRGTEDVLRLLRIELELDVEFSGWMLDRHCLAIAGRQHGDACRHRAR